MLYRNNRFGSILLPLFENKVTMKRQEKTFFATIEGGEGAGKSLFIKNLSAALTSRSVTHTTTREPGGTLIAEKLRTIFHEVPPTEELTIEAEFFIVSAARAQHVKNKVLPSLEKGSSVICDRFVDSSRVYQGVLGGLDLALIESVSRSCTFGVQADITFLLDCDPAVGLARVEERFQRSGGDHSEKTRFDKKSLQYHEKIREAFLSLAEKEKKRFKVLDATQSPEALVTEAMAHLESLNFL